MDVEWAKDGVDGTSISCKHVPKPAVSQRSPNVMTSTISNASGRRSSAAARSGRRLLRGRSAS